MRYLNGSALLWKSLGLGILSLGSGYMVSPGGRAALHASVVQPVLAITAPEKKPQATKPKPATAKKSTAKRGKASRPRSGVGYRRVQVAGIPVHVVQADLRRPEVQLGVATGQYGIGYRDMWPSMIHRTRPVAAITGTYFCTSSAIPVGSIVVGGKRVHRGSVGTVFVYDRKKGARIVTCKPGRSFDSTGAETLLRAGPRLLTKGRRTLFPQAEGFRDPAVFARKRRAALGLTRSGKLMMVAVDRPILLRELATVMGKLGAVDAMALDGGDSAALYYRGRTRVLPHRPLTNLLVLYDSKQRYERYADVLVPNGIQVVKSPEGPRG